MHCRVRETMEDDDRKVLFRGGDDAATTKAGDDSGGSSPLVDALLQPIREASSTDQQVEALKQLRESISQSSTNIRENVAETLLGSTSCPTTTSPAFHAIQDCLIECGHSVAISTAIRALRKLATTSNQNDISAAFTDDCDPIITLDLCLAILRRLVLSRDDHDNGNPLADLLLVQESSSTYHHDKSSFLPWQHKHSITVVFEMWVQMVVLIPNTVASACHALRVPLPTWAAPSKYNARLVLLAAAAAVASDKKHSKENVVDDDDANNLMMYFHTLVRHILRRPGGEDQVALALYQMYAERQKKEEGDMSATTTTTCLSLLQSLVPRESARLSRAMLRLVLSKTTATSNSVFPDITSTENAPRWRDVWLESTIRQLWLMGSDSDKDHADAFVKLAVFSSSSILTPGKQMDWQFCYAVASLLACTSMDDGDNDGSNGNSADRVNGPGSFVDDDDDDDDSTDDEELMNENVSASDRLLYRYLMQAAQSWSQGDFVRQTEAPMQRHVTYFLRSSLSLLVKLDALSLLTERLLQGVEERLGLTDIDTRKDGMYVGVLLAQGIGGKVEFEELKDEAESTTKPDFVENADADAERSSDKREPGPKSQEKKHFVPRQFNPDAEFISDEDEETGSEKSEDDDDDDSVWEDSSALEPYNLNDDEEDLRRIPKPRYLAECIDLLRIPETEENAASCHETALQEVFDLVRSRPIDLPDLGPDLAKELLRFENKFYLEHFHERVTSSLCSLAVEEPVAVGRTLIVEMFQDSGLVNRLRVLETLSEAALELSGEKELRDRKTPSSESSQGAERIQDDQEAEALTQFLGSNAPRMRAVQTRRWGRGRGRNTEGQAIQNRFGPIAPGWFYLLLGHFIEQRDSTKLWRGSSGATLLSSLFFTLATIVECCGNTLGADILAKDLIQLVWSFRGADVAEVRVSVLFVVASCFPLLRDKVALTMILDDSPNSIGRDLLLIAANDPDENCRQLAALVFRSVSSVAKSIGGFQGSLLF